MEKRNMPLCKIQFMKRVIGIGIGLYIFVKIVCFLNYIYVEPIDSEWERILWHHYYEDRGKIDNLYLGSSHVYCDVNPMLLDSLTGQYNFNLASSAQLMNGTYYLLKEADKDNQLSHVYIELYYGCNVKDNLEPDKEDINTRYDKNWHNTDYMKMSANKLAYMLSIAGADKYADICLPFVRYRMNLGNWDYIKQVIEKKNQEDYLSYKYHYDCGDGNGYDEYKGQGYFDCTRIYLDKARLYPQQKVLSENPMGEKAEEYLRIIIDYCKEKNIPITLFVSPINELQLISTGNYDYYITQVKNIAEECGVAFYDFNLVKEEYLSIQQGKYFKDADHLNSFGAEIFTPFLHRVVSGNREENEKYFYNSYAEKLRETEPAIYGIYYRYSDEESAMTRTMWIASNRESGMEYKIIVRANEGEQYLIQDFDENKEFTIPIEEEGTCIITARMKGSLENIQIMEVNY